MARVTVIIPAYNVEDSIPAAIGSARAQTERNIEILVIDDASTDGTVQKVLAQARSDDRVRLIRALSNGGAGAARNLGIAQAKGDWIALLDADDSYHPERLERLLALAARTDADMVADNLMAYARDRPEERRPLLPENWLPEGKRLGPLKFLNGIMGRGNSRMSYGLLQPMVRRSFLERHGIRHPEIRFSEDLVFQLECLLAGAVWVVTPEPLYEYAVSPGSMTGAHPILGVDQLLAEERRLLSHPAALRDPRVAAALRRHIASVEMSRSWRIFAEALKQRDARGAAAALFESPRGFGHISREGVRALPRAVAKLASSVRGRSARTT